MDFQKICRLCCEERSEMQSLFAEPDRHLWIDVFSRILCIQLEQNDGLPQNICANCMMVMENIQDTIEQFRSNDKLLREKLRLAFVPAVKVEAIDTVDDASGDIFQIELDTETIKDEPDSSQNEDKSDAEASSSATASASEAECKLTDSCESQESQPVKKKGKHRLKKEKRQENQPVKQPRMYWAEEPIWVYGSDGRRRPRRDPNLPRVNDYKCYICKSESLGSNAALHNHLFIHTDQLPYTCQICEKEVVVIENISTLNIHKRMHELPVKCDQCDRRYSTKYTYAQHVQRDHSGGNVPSQCGICNKVCPSKGSLQYHMLTHTKAVSCEYCGKMMSQKHKLELHIRRKHQTESTKVECDICHKFLKSVDSLRTHTKIYHLNQEFKCKICDKSYAAETSLRYHEKKHKENPNYKSSKDWKKYYTFVEADSGQNSSGRLKQCNICHEVVKSIGVHLKNMHFSDPFCCKLCDAAFKRKEFYDMHMLEHKHGKMFQCPICNREFYMKRLLLAHLKTQKHRNHPLAQNLDWLYEKELDVRQLLISDPITSNSSAAAEATEIATATSSVADAGV